MFVLGIIIGLIVETVIEIVILAKCQKAGREYRFRMQFHIQDVDKGYGK